MTTPPASISPTTTSRLIYGCMGLGGGWNNDPLQADDVAHAQAAVEAALDIGITLFDHANIYTLGKAEQCFGELFKQQTRLRQRMQLQTKCGICFADASGPKRYDLSAAHIIESVHASLRRLNTDYLDVLMLHRPDPLMEPDEINEAWGSLGKGWYSGGAPQDAAPAVSATAELVQQLADEHGVTRESIVLAWLLKHPARIQPVIGTANSERIRACADATRVALTRGQWYALYQSARGRELP